MPLPIALPLAPVAGIALRYGAVAVAGYALARRIEPGRRDQRAEDAQDELQEGVTLRRDGGDVSTTGRFCRTIRMGASGPGVRVDISGIGRIRVRRVKPDT